VDLAVPALQSRRRGEPAIRLIGDLLSSTAQMNGWTTFVSMQNQYSLMYVAALSLPAFILTLGCHMTASARKNVR
jgi:hypothetical protein